MTTQPTREDIGRYGSVSARHRAEREPQLLVTLREERSGARVVFHCASFITEDHHSLPLLRFEGVTNRYGASIQRNAEANRRAYQIADNLNLRHGENVARRTSLTADDWTVCSVEILHAA